MDWHRILAWWCHLLGKYSPHRTLVLPCAPPHAKISTGNPAHQSLSSVTSSLSPNCLTFSEHITFCSATILFVGPIYPDTSPSVLEGSEDNISSLATMVVVGVWVVVLLHPPINRSSGLLSSSLSLGRSSSLHSYRSSSLHTMSSSKAGGLVRMVTLSLLRSPNPSLGSRVQYRPL